MKRVLAALAVSLLVFCGGMALAEEAEESDLSISEGVELWLGDIDWSVWERELAGLPDAVRALWNGLGTRETTRQIAETGDIGAALWGGGALWDLLPQLFMRELKSAAGFFALLLSVIMISSVGAALAGDKGAQTADVAGMVCRCVLLLVVLTAFTTLARTTVDCIASLGSFILLVAGTIALPMLRLLAYQLLLRLAAAVAQPLTGAGQAGMLRAGASMIGSLLSACVAVALMFIVTLGLITGLGGTGYL